VLRNSYCHTFTCAQIGWVTFFVTTSVDHTQKMHEGINTGVDSGTAGRIAGNWGEVWCADMRRRAKLYRNPQLTRFSAESLF
jgi:hypothetical protein